MKRKENKIDFFKKILKNTRQEKIKRKEEKRERTSKHSSIRLRIKRASESCFK